MSEYQKENKILFNRKKLRRSRVRAMNYDIRNFIYEHTAQDLTSRLDEINREFKSILILTKNKNFISAKSLTKKIKDPLIVSPISLSNVYTHLLISEQRVISCKAQVSNFVLRMIQQLRLPRKMFINW